jgi:hypothetical protein
MPLETPNRVVAAGVILVDPLAADPTDVYSFRSNNGFRDLVATDPTSVTTALTKGLNAQLDTPVSNDEAVVLIGGDEAFGPARIAGWVTPSWTQIGVALVDDLPDYRLVALIQQGEEGSHVPAVKARLNVSVFQVITAEAKVPGQPVAP